MRDNPMRPYGALTHPYIWWPSQLRWDASTPLARPLVSRRYYGDGYQTVLCVSEAPFVLSTLGVHLRLQIPERNARVEVGPMIPTLPDRIRISPKLHARLNRSTQ